MKSFIDTAVDKRVKAYIVDGFERRLAVLEQSRDTAAGEIVQLKSCQEDVFKVVQEIAERSTKAAHDIVQEASDEHKRFTIQAAEEYKGELLRLTLLCEDLRLCTFSSHQGRTLMDSLSLQEAALSDLQELHDGLRGRHERHALDISELQEQHEQHTLSVSKLDQTHCEHRARHEIAIAEIRQLVSEGQNRHLFRLEELHEKASHKVMDVELGLQKTEQAFTHLAVNVQELVDWRSESKYEKSREAIKMEGLVVDLKKLMIAQEDAKRGLQELHAEMVDSFRGEAAAVANLEQQLDSLGAAAVANLETHRELEKQMKVLAQDMKPPTIGKLVCGPPVDCGGRQIRSPRVDNEKLTWIAGDF